MWQWIKETKLCHQAFKEEKGMTNTIYFRKCWHLAKNEANQVKCKQLFNLGDGKWVFITFPLLFCKFESLYIYLKGKSEMR